VPQVYEAHQIQTPLPEPTDLPLINPWPLRSCSLYIAFVRVAFGIDLTISDVSNGSLDDLSNVRIASERSSSIKFLLAWFIYKVIDRCIDSFKYFLLFVFIDKFIGD